VTAPLTAQDVATAVREHFGAEHDTLAPEWAALAELARAPGAGNARADLFLVRAWRSRPTGHERVLVEIKVSRADLAHELAHPTKLDTFARYAHRVYFATPAGLVGDTALPDGAGLLEVTPDRQVHCARRAHRNHDALPLPEPMVVEVFRRAARAEARTRHPDQTDLPAQLAAARERLAAAERAAETARKAATRDRRRLQSWAALLTAAGGVPCVCGATLAPLTATEYSRRHADRSPCPTGYPTVDVAALAERLGLQPPDLSRPA
jgi:hypothetical protein